MLTRSKVGATIALLVVLVPAVLLVARNWVDLDLDVQKDPLEYVDVIDKGRPITPALDGMLAQLDRVTGARWDAVSYQDWSTDGERFAGNDQAQSALSQSVLLPVPQGVTGVATNTHPDGTADRFGGLYIIWFHTPAHAEEWLVEKPANVFTDPEVEAQRTTYWAGSFVVYYAPPADGRDWSPEVRRVVEESTR